MSPLSSRSKEPHRGSGAAPGGGSSGPTLPKDFQRGRGHHTLRLYPNSQVEDAPEFGAAHQAPTQSVWFGLYCSSYKLWRPSRAVHGLPRNPNAWNLNGKAQARRPAWHLQVQLRGPCLRARELTHELPRGAPGIGTNLLIGPGRQVRVPGLAVQ